MVIPCSSIEPVRSTEHFEVRFVDSATGLGIPLVEVSTVHNLKWVSDNAGRIAVAEPHLLNRETFFHVSSHGYEAKKDGFGFAGVRLTPVSGKKVEVALTRVMPGERIVRLTGEAPYRDSKMLGYPDPPGRTGMTAGGLCGQDSVQAVVYRKSVRWFWGDTNRISYPLGLYRTAGAKTPLLDRIDPTAGIAFDYFVDSKGFARAMIPIKERPQGVVWIDGLCVAADTDGTERMICHYSRRKGLAEELEHGIAVFNDTEELFEPVVQLPREEKWRHPFGQATTLKEGGTDYLVFGNPLLTVRVPAVRSALLNPDKYEAFTCGSGDPNAPVRRDVSGRVDWRWQKKLPPISAENQLDWIRKGYMKSDEARFAPINAADPSERIRLHNGTTRWNDFRKKWIMIAGQIGGKSSFLGEIWYAESDTPTGPFDRAVKIATHQKKTLYNVCHHPFLDRRDGRDVYFEGTYTAEFSGNPDKTMLYDYNQILFRLDLDSPAIRASRK